MHRTVGGMERAATRHEAGQDTMLDFDPEDDDEPRTMIFAALALVRGACPRNTGGERLMLILAIDTSAVASAALISDDAMEACWNLSPPRTPQARRRYWRP